MSTTAIASAVKFQVNLNVSSLARSVLFYRALLSAEPAQAGPDYACFELTQPPLILGLVQSTQVHGGTLNHTGFRLADQAALDEVKRRLEEAGIPMQSQEGVECCYARQTKLWVTDPDRNLWEIYVFEEDLDHSGFEDVASRPPAPPELGVWTHHLTGPAPARIPHGDGTLDEVRLEGTINAAPEAVSLASLLKEARRVLKPAGKVILHGMASEHRLSRPPQLPGLAALVQHVPTVDDTSAALRGAGFGGIFIEKMDRVCLELEGFPMHELILVGSREEEGSGSLHVLYKGPLAAVEDDGGTPFPRGERVAVSTSVWNRLRLGPAADSFLFFPAPEGAAPAQ